MIAKFEPHPQYKGIMDSPQMCVAIRKYAAGGCASRDVAKEYGISKTHLLRVYKSRKGVWGHDS